VKHEEKSQRDALKSGIHTGKARKLNPPLLIHSVGDRLYGFWHLVSAIIGYYGLLDLGIVSAIQYHVAKSSSEKGQDSLNRILSTSLMTLTALGVIVFVISALVALISQYVVPIPEEATLFGILMLIVGSSFALGFPCRVITGILAGNLRFDLISLVDTGSLVTRTTLIVAVLKSGYGITSVALVTVLVQIASYLTSVLIVRKIHKFRFVKENISLS